MKTARPIAQICFFLLFFSVPLLNIFRIDFLELRFFLFGRSFSFNEGYILLLSVLLFVFLFVGISKWFGRQFCGWVCPHNTFSVYANKFIHSSLISRFPRLKIAVNAFLPALLAPIIGFSALSYFIDPATLFQQIVSLRWNNGLFGVYLLLSVFFFIMIFRLRSRFCRHACPYGIFQMTFANKQSKIRGVKNMFQGAGLALSIIVFILISLLGLSFFSTTGYAAIIEKEIDGAPTGEYLTYAFTLKVQNNHREPRSCSIHYEGIPTSWEVALPERIHIGADQAQEETLVFRVDPTGLNQRHDIVIAIKDENGAVIEKELVIYPVRR